MSFSSLNLAPMNANPNLFVSVVSVVGTNIKTEESGGPTVYRVRY